MMIMMMMVVGVGVVVVVEVVEEMTTTMMKMMRIVEMRDKIRTTEGFNTKQNGKLKYLRGIYCGMKIFNISYH